MDKTIIQIKFRNQSRQDTEIIQDIIKTYFHIIKEIK